MKQILVLTAAISLLVSCNGQEPILPAARRIETWLPLIEGKQIGIVANQTSLIGETHLVDSLYRLGNTDPGNPEPGRHSRSAIRIRCVFSPEHGFRGQAGAGQEVRDETDPLTGLKVVSLYGRNRKPAPEQMEELDLVLFDIQDVGTRFYTYISTLFYVMQACAENEVPLLVLDRPNPNGFYVDGPLLDTSYRSFVGMHPVPVVYGMTIGEYARMINGEGWLGDALFCRLEVIPCQGYTHASYYKLPVPPSPNLPNMNAVYLYPSLCFFEGTVLSEGRGTDFPFEVFGHPELEGRSFRFTPESRPGFARHPKLEGEVCRGTDLRHLRGLESREGRIQLHWLIEAYRDFPDKDGFFIPYFENLAGTRTLREQIRAGLGESEIRTSWQADLEDFQKIRNRYLIYP